MSMNLGSTKGSNLGLDFDARSSATKSKFIKERVTGVEKHFGDICASFGAIARKNGKLRDKEDELMQQILVYSENLTYNSSSKAALKSFSHEAASCNDYQDVMVKRIESHVVEPLMLFDTVIKNSRDDIQAAFKAYDAEQKSKKNVERMREQNPSDRHSLSQAETKLQKAQVNASRSAKALEEAIDKFEEQKLQDLKRVLNNYVKVQMSYHAKCLESLTKAYRSLSVLDDNKDLEEFRAYLHPTNAAERLHMMRGGSVNGSRASLNSQRSDISLGTLPQKSIRATPQRPTVSWTPARSPAKTSQADMFSTQQRSAPSPSRSYTTPTKPTNQPTSSAMMGDLESDETSEEDSDGSEYTDDETSTPQRR